MNNVIKAIRKTNYNIAKKEFEIKKNIMMILLILGPMLACSFVGFKVGSAINPDSGLVIMSSILVGYFIGCGFAVYFATICDNYEIIIKENG